MSQQTPGKNPGGSRGFFLTTPAAAVVSPWKKQIETHVPRGKEQHIHRCA